MKTTLWKDRGKRLLCICVCLCLCIHALSSLAGGFNAFASDLSPAELAIAEHGWEWEIEDGVLTISILPGGSTTWPDIQQRDLPWHDYRNTITKVVLPEGLRNIGYAAFGRTTSSTPGIKDTDPYHDLKEVTFPSTLETIGECAFRGFENFVTELEKVELSHTKLTSIERCAFQDSGLTEINLPDTLEEMGVWVFENSKRLKTIDLSNTKLTSIPNNTFQNSGLTSINFPDDLVEIESNAFYYCTGLAEVDLSNTKLEVIGARAFQYASGLTKIIFPESFKEIESYAFGVCSNLRIADFSETQLESIGFGAFMGTAIDTLNLPYTLHTIQAAAFWSCTNFKDVFIPPNVTYLGEYTEYVDRVFDTSIIIFVNNNHSYAIEWADKQGYRWFYQAHKLEMQASPPPDIHQNVPVEFTFNTEIPGNRGMKFEVSPELPAGLFLQADDKGDYAPGTIYGVVTDPDEIEKHDGETFTFTAYPVSYTDEFANYTQGKYDVKVSFVLTLVPGSDDPTVSGDVKDMFDFKGGEEGRLGGETGEVEFDENGELITDPNMSIDAPFSGSEEGEYGFQDFYINGKKQKEGVDYDVTEGSTIITIRDQTFAGLGDGNHTASATFRRIDAEDISLETWQAKEWDVKVQPVSQTFTLINSNSLSVPDPEIELDPESETEPKTEPETESETESETEPETNDPDPNVPDPNDPDPNDPDPNDPDPNNNQGTNNNPVNTNPRNTNPRNTNPQNPGTEPLTAEYINDEIILEALETEDPVIDLSETDTNTVISADMLQVIAESGRDVEVVLENGFTYTILADSITPEARPFYLNVDIYFTNETTTIDGVTITANSIVIDPNFSGEFGFDIKITFTAEQLRENGIIDGNNVSLFHIDRNGNVTDLGKVDMNADGSVEFTINHASYYVLAEAAPEGLIFNPAAGNERTGNNDGNPPTGVTTGLVNAILSGTAVTFIIVKKRKFRKEAH